MRFVLPLFFVICFSSVCHAAKYPISRLEKEIEEMGSIFGEGGLKSTLKNNNRIEDTSTIGNVNKFLYLATLKRLKGLPLNIKDPNMGIIMTDWHKSSAFASGAKNKATQYKIIIIINSPIMTAEAIEARVFTRVKDRKSKEWHEDGKNQNNLSRAIEEEILQLAKDFYITSKVKK